VIAFNPLEEPAGGPNFNEFSDDVLYELHITRGAGQLIPEVTYQFRFTTTRPPRVNVADLGLAPGGGKEFFIQLSGYKQTMTVTQIRRGQAPSVIASNVPVAPANIGPRTFTVAYKAAYGTNQNSYNDAFAAEFIRPTSEGGQVWAGPRDDGFYVDLGGVFDLANLRGVGMAQDNVAGYNCHAIAISIPTTRLTANGQAPPAGASDANLLGVYSTSSRRAVEFRLGNGQRAQLGPWVQVSRLGLPLINEAVIGLQDKDYWNATRPIQEGYFFPYFLNPIIVRDAEAVGIYRALGVDPNALGLKSGRTDIIDVINLRNIPNANAHNVPVMPRFTGDVLRVDMGINSGFPNGRPLVGGSMPNREQADVTDVLLSVLLSKGMVPIRDNANSNDKPFLATIPWLPLPWEGYSQGHGRLAP
jgi:hypothetical protein